jgi:perosamine synthetase
MRKIPQIEPVLGSEERAAVLAIMDSGFITEGRKTRELESELARFFGVPHALVVNNATVALTIALQGLGVGPGDEVIVPDFTFIATANAVSLAGTTPIFADVCRETFAIDLADAEQCISKKTRAILPVHLNGRAPDMAALLELASKYNLSVVEDAAQAMGSAHKGQFLGTFGDAGIFSLGTTKIITSGQGGVILTKRKDLYEACVRLKDHGRLQRSAELHDNIGFNSKFTDIQAALALAQLRKLPERIEKKREIFRWYQQELSSVLAVTIPPMDLRETVPWFVDMLHSERAALQAHLESAAIETRRFYLPLHTQPCYRSGGPYPVTDYISVRGMWLPSSVNLTRREVARICEQIASFCDLAERARIEPVVFFR